MLYIPRTLELFVDLEEKGFDWVKTTIEELAEKQAIILLGAPGAGKTYYLRALEGEGYGVFCSASKCVRGRGPERSVQGRLLIDAFDECCSLKSEAKKGALIELTDQLYDYMPSPFILSCREADWQHLIDSELLKEELELEEVAIVRLVPFNSEEIVSLMNQMGVDEALFAFSAAQSLGLAELFGNPQTLSMLCDVYKKYGQWPSTKKALYEDACKILAIESGKKKKEVEAPDTVLKKAGSLFAVQLLSGRDSIALDSRLAQDSLYAKEISDDYEWRTILDYRLFVGVDGDEYTHIHRTVAEFLGAQYLVNRVNDGADPTRIVSLVRSSYGIPTRLRGLAGWMCCLSPEFARLIFQIDPFAIFHSGDFAVLPSPIKQLYLKVLVELASSDVGLPFEQIRWTNFERFGALWDASLIAPIENILSSSEHDHNIYDVAMAIAVGGAEKSKELVPTLLSFVRKKDVQCMMRANAIEPIHIIDPNSDEQLVELLCGVIKEEVVDYENQLLGELLAVLYPRVISVADLHKFLVPRSKRLFGAYNNFLNRLPEITPAEGLVALVNSLVENQVKLDYARSSSYRETMHELLLTTLETSSKPLMAEDVFRWISNMSEWYGAFCDRAGDKFRERFKRWSVLNRKLSDELWQIFLEKGALGDWDLCRFFGEVISKPTHSQLEKLCFTVAQLDGHRETRELNRFIMYLGAALVKDPFTSDEERCMQRLAEVSEDFGQCWDISRRCDLTHKFKEMERKKKADRRHAKVLAKCFRNDLLANIDDMKKGKALPLLASIARGYLHGYRELRGKTPDDRLYEMCGDRFYDDVCKIFTSLLTKEDFPSVLEIAELATQKKMPWHTLPVLAALELLKNVPSDEIDLFESALKFAVCSWANQSISDDEQLIAPLIAYDSQRVANALVDCWKIMLEVCPDSVRNLSRLACSDVLVEIAGGVAERLWLECESLSWESESYLLKTLVKDNCRDVLFPRVIDYLDKKEGLLSSVRDYSYLGLAFLWGEYRNFDYVVDVFSKEEALEILMERSGLLEEGELNLSCEQLGVLIRIYLMHAEVIDRGGGTFRSTLGERAYRRAQSHLQELAQDSSEVATELLLGLIDDDLFAKWKSTLAYYVRIQMANRREAITTFPEPKDVLLALNDGKPATHGDFLELVHRELQKIAKDIRDGKNNEVQMFWTPECDARRPSARKNPSAQLIPVDEETARDRFSALLAKQLDQYGLHREPHNRDSKRTDILISDGNMEIPIEAKGQWNSGGQASCGIWDGIEKQLIPLYARSPQANGHGVFLVFWFGPEVKLASPPRTLKIPKPKSPEELAEQLLKTIPTDYKNTIRIVVVDCSV